MPLFQRLLTWNSREAKAGPSNMAVDEALLLWAANRVPTLPVLRIYRWRESAVSLGYFQRVAEAVDFAKGRALVRRWTGGGLVEHGAENQLTYTLIVPRDHPFASESTLESYMQIHRHIAQAMISVGIRCRIFEGQSPPPGGACFVRPAPGDILDSAGRKIAGAGQRRSHAGLLHQGSLQLLHAVPPTLAARLASELGGQCDEIDLNSDGPFSAEVTRIERERYGTTAWLERR